MREAELRAAVDAELGSGPRRWLTDNRVSTRHRYVAFMAAKAACSTIKLALHTLETPEVVVENWWDIHFRHAVPSLADYTADEVVEMLSSPDWLRFCVVRNPYTRLASGWKQKLISDNDGGYEWLRRAVRAAAGIAPGAPIPFAASVEYLLESQSMADDPHWAPMTATMRPDIVDYDVVGRFETFVDDFTGILARIGAPSEVVAMAGVVTNATAPVALTDLYDARLAGRVYEHYQADFEAFGYPEASWTWA